MKNVAVIAAVAAVASAQNGTAAPVSLTISTQTFTSCTTGTGALAPVGTVTGVTTVTEPCTHAACTGTGTLAPVMPTGTGAPGTFTTVYSTVYTMYCPTATASNYLQAYTTTITETCVGATPTFASRTPGYVPSGFTSEVVTCTACGASPVSTGMIYPTTSIPTGAYVPPSITTAPASSCPGGANCPMPSPSTPGSPSTPAESRVPGTGSSCPGGVNCPAPNSPSTPTGPTTCPGGANCPSTPNSPSTPNGPSTCPGGVNCPSTPNSPSTPNGPSTCPGGVNCPSTPGAGVPGTPATGAGRYANGTTSPYQCPGGAMCPVASSGAGSTGASNGTSTPLYRGAAGRESVAVSSLLGAALAVVGAVYVL